MDDRFRKDGDSDQKPYVFDVTAIIQPAAVLAGATKFSDGNVNFTYRGSIKVGNNIVAAVIKDLTPRQLANELIFASVALQLGLPIPPSYIAFASKKRLETLRAPLTTNGSFVFATKDMGIPSVKFENASAGDLQAVLGGVDWAEFGAIYGLDILTANVDRNTGNILITGDGLLWMIDHDQCLSGPSWKEEDLTDFKKEFMNKLDLWVVPYLDEKQKAAAKNLVYSLIERARKLDMEKVIEFSRMKDFTKSSERKTIQNFLASRMPHVGPISAKSLTPGSLV
jgi:hypothetical protein